MSIFPDVFKENTEQNWILKAFLLHVKSNFDGVVYIPSNGDCDVNDLKEKFFLRVYKPRNIRNIITGTVVVSEGNK